MIEQNIIATPMSNKNDNKHIISRKYMNIAKSHRWYELNFQWNSSLKSTLKYLIKQL